MGQAARARAAGRRRGRRRRPAHEGFIKPIVHVDAEALLDYLRPFLDAARAREFTFSRAWLRGICRALNDPRRPQLIVGLKLNLPPEYLLIHRVWLGGIGVLCQIGGTVPAREVILGCLPGTDLGGRRGGGGEEERGGGGEGGGGGGMRPGGRGQ